jgi:hypothetical protein
VTIEFDRPERAGQQAGSAACAALSGFRTDISHLNPGRCPGLVWGCPFGANEVATFGGRASESRKSMLHERGTIQLKQRDVKMSRLSARIDKSRLLVQSHVFADPVKPRVKHSMPKVLIFNGWKEVAFAC